MRRDEALVFKVYDSARGGRASFPGFRLADLPAHVLGSSFDRYKALGVWNTSPRLRREGCDWLRDAVLAGGLLRSRIEYDDCVDMRFAECVAREDPPAN